MADPSTWTYRLLEKTADGLANKTGRHEYQEILPNAGSVEAPVSTPLFFEPRGGPFAVHLVEATTAEGAVVAERPAYFVVAYPIGITDIRTVVLFAHPAPTAGYDDADYAGQGGGWNAILRYGRYFGCQITAARKNLIFVMPVFSRATFGTLGVFPSKWEVLLTGVLTRVQSEIWPDRDGKPTPRYSQVADRLILACYSLGRQVARSMLAAGGLQSRVVEVWDLDGVGSSPIQLAGKPSYYCNQASSGFGFHVPLSRWTNFPNYAGLVKKEKEMAAHGDRAGAIHGEIVLRLAYHAAVRSSFG